MYKIPQNKTKKWEPSKLWDSMKSPILYFSQHTADFYSKCYHTFPGPDGRVFQAKTQENKVVKFLFENVHHWFPQKQKFEGLLLKGSVADSTHRWRKHVWPQCNFRYAQEGSNYKKNCISYHIYIYVNKKDIMKHNNYICKLLHTYLGRSWWTLYNTSLLRILFRVSFGGKFFLKWAGYGIHLQWHVEAFVKKKQCPTCFF